ncbi:MULTISPECIES: MBL fold metallo-hydrolase [unclassified Mesorhizobium]|uniref:MBL fold metallo-hydrolase n=1 Tax=unclassified Mesorhizobium TaxID=325217 RepID=UPI00112ED85F|nr:MULTISPECIES: MBL fold metallo-hydrolase [unclassified Mesorhizobium]TPI50388.1 MBL fold metallo-hydrolase [Mesorhizobium sp. B3-1-1]TPJ68583.1 MBL fold metallo-hydrolase [Mesorhizobium sp. B2-6-7]TPJ78742.1 MBL fold metallo-hydrolase [Mesorhizobium sp. B2-6-3]TPJ95574.1 MBL fold metallo-hydrolase [Mesorhizobium sp. B2-5-10]TPK12119.1 MBL fold metallo-hydrolase [Mesorhizobium sp. B2-5-11]
MTCFLCLQCGVQFAQSEAPPQHCPICEDERQYVRWEGQAWTTPEELAAGHRLVMKGDAGVLAFGIEPRFAIGQRALLTQTPHGNVLWDCISMVTDEAVAEINRRGGLAGIAISHCHYYSVMVEWSEAFGGVPIYLHDDDRQWIMRPHPSIVSWQGETLDLTLIRCGGHFAGGQVLHWKREGGNALLAGDILQVTPTRRHVSFMYSYPNYIPLNAAAVRRIAAALEPFTFDDIYGAWWNQNIIGGAKQALAASVARYLTAIA